MAPPSATAILAASARASSSWPRRLVDHAHQPPVLRRIGIEGAHAAQLGHPRGRVDGVDQVPGREVEVDRARHLARRLLGRSDAVGAVAEQRQHALELDPAVEVGAGDMDAVVGEDVALALGTSSAGRPDPDDREVGSAAADVGHQHLLLAAHLLLVVEGGGDRLVLELDLAKARSLGGAAQRPLGLGVALGIVVDEEHRPAEHRAADRGAGCGLGAAPEVGEVGGDDVEVAHGPAAADVGALLDQRAAEDALHRAHQPAVDAVDVGGDRGPAELAVRPPVQAAVGGVEHGGRHRPLAGLELDQAHSRLRPSRRRSRSPSSRCRNRWRSSRMQWSSGEAILFAFGPRREALE